MKDGLGVKSDLRVQRGIISRSTQPVTVTARSAAAPPSHFYLFSFILFFSLNNYHFNIFSSNVGSCVVGFFFSFCRHRCCIDGWSQRSAWRTSLERWNSQLRGRRSPALLVTQDTTTAKTPPVCPAHLEPTLMEHTVGKVQTSAHH